MGSPTGHLLLLSRPRPQHPQPHSCPLPALLQALCLAPSAPHLLSTSCGSRPLAAPPLALSTLPSDFRHPSLRFPSSYLRSLSSPSPHYPPTCLPSFPLVASRYFDSFLPNPLSFLTCCLPSHFSLLVPSESPPYWPALLLSSLLPYLPKSTLFLASVSPLGPAPSATPSPAPRLCLVPPLLIFQSRPLASVLQPPPFSRKFLKPVWDQTSVSQPCSHFPHLFNGPDLSSLVHFRSP